MKEFPQILNIDNKDNFRKLYTERLKCYLRRDLYEHIISHEEKDYFSLDAFNSRVEDIELVKDLVKQLIPELEELGWKCKLSFGDTGLFIFSKEQPPNCF